MTFEPRPIIVPDICNILVRGPAPNGEGWEVVFEGKVTFFSDELLSAFLELEAAWYAPAGTFKSRRSA